MSRSYNEDWERRKAYLIRSLFHDIPFRALSPVPEFPEESLEVSTRSSETQVPQQSTSSHEIYSESRTSSSSTAPDPVSPPSDVYKTRDTRPYSPLPPLIIERMPNKHDEPPEYYQTLLNKIRLIYRKMFIEGKNLSDDDFMDSDHERQSIMDDIFEMAASLSDLSEVNHSISSDGYSADTEMSDVEESNDIEKESNNIAEESNNIEEEPIDIEEESRSINEDDDGKRTVGNNDKRLKLDEVEGCADNNVSSRENNIQGDGEETARGQIASDEEADYRQITTQADVHIDGEQLAAVRASPVYEEQSVQFTPMMISRVVVHTRSTEELLPVTPDPFFKEPTVDIPLVLENAQKYSEQPEDPKVHVIEELSLAPTANITYEDPLDTALKVIHGVGVLQDISMAVSDDLATSPILPYARRPKRTDPISQERSEVSEDQDARQRQAVSQTETHNQSSSENQESRATQNKAFVLRFRKSAEHSYIAEREVIQEDNEDPTPSTEETENHSNNHIEVMRALQPRASMASIPANINRHTSDMDLTCEQDIGPRDISTVTSNSQDGCHDNTADSITSCDIHDILTSIFNGKSPENMEINESSKENMAVGSEGRKRTYGEMSQRENVSWSDLRANFFVGTPKIFRLCSCADHVCNFSLDNQTR